MSRNGFKVGDMVMIAPNQGAMHGCWVGRVARIDEYGTEVVDTADYLRAGTGPLWGNLTLVKPGSAGSIGPANDEIPEDEMEIARYIGAPGCDSIEYEAAPGQWITLWKADGSC